MSDTRPLSLEDLLTTVDSLARTVARKNLELEVLKKSYDEKLLQINQYIELVQNAVKPQRDEQGDSDNWEQISEERFLALVNQKVECSGCNSTLWDNTELLEYMLIPKKTLKYLLRKPEESLTDAFGKLRTTPVPSSATTFSSVLSQRRREQTRSKKTCSYCHKPGHSRAKCFTRLSNPVTSNVPVSDLPSTQ